MNETLEPTSEQANILSLATGSSANLMINALAGTGKTTMIEMIEKVVPAPILYMVFSRRNVDEAAEKMLSTTTVRNFNGMGHRVWAKAIPHELTLAKTKSQDILRAIIDESPKNLRDVMWDSFWPVVQGVSVAKALGYVPEGKFPSARRLISQGAFHASLEETPDDLVADLIDESLLRSIKAAYAGTVDYNDQIYMPTLFGGTFPRFPLVTVDEYQDLNPINHAMLDRLVRSRVIGVGDPWQNIYGFRGALASGMAEAKAKFSMTECDLSVSFRCPQAIVENARWRVPHFNWSKMGGSVEQLKSLNPVDIVHDAVFICRNNAPLFRVAIHLLSHRRSVSVGGSDVGPKLLAIMKKLGDSGMSRASLLSAIDDWLAEKLARSSTTAQDLADCMKVFASFGSTLGQSLAYAEHLFAQKGTIRLLTGHKAKGLEFDTVYHLDPWLLREDEQDLNLRYVIETRSRDKYFEINSTDIQW